MSTEHEKIRERIMELGGDDINMGWYIPSGRNREIQFRNNMNFRHSSTVAIAPPQVFRFDSLKKVISTPNCEIVACQALLGLVCAQKQAVYDIEQYRAPRSDSFGFWLDVAKKSITQKENELSDYLLSSGNEFGMIDINHDTPKMSKVKPRIVEYAIKHILDDDIRTQAVSQTELINISEDAIFYITFAENTAPRFDEKNSVFVEYMKKHFSLSIRDDYCCKHCDSDLFVGIPYCLCCNTPLSR